MVNHIPLSFWDVLTLFICFGTAVLSAYEFAFQEKRIGHLFMLDVLEYVLLSRDLLLQLQYPYIEKRTNLLVTSFGRCAWRYLRSRFFFDLISMVPYFLVEKISHTTILRYFRLARLWRLWQVFHYFGRLENDVKWNYYFVRWPKLICIVVCTIHFEACGFYFMAAKFSSKTEKTYFSLLDGSTGGLRDQYMTALYWAITTLTSVGYGDIHAVDFSEKVFSSMVMLLNIGLMTYITGYVSALILENINQTRNFRDTVKAAIKLCRKNDIRDDLKKELMDHVYLDGFIKMDHQQMEIVARLPRSLGSRISTHNVLSVITSQMLFRNVPHQLLESLVSKVKTEYFAPNTNVISSGQVASHFFMLADGIVQYVGNTDQTPYLEVERGAIGSMAFLCGILQPFTVRTKRFTKLFRVDRADLVDILGSTEAKHSMLINSFESLKNSEVEQINQYAQHWKDMLEAMEIQIPIDVP